jgi:peptidyl-dipeptidase Dcp
VPKRKRLRMTDKINEGHMPLRKNPLLGKWDTPFEAPPFGLIEVRHFIPAVNESIKAATDEINSITENPEPPDFMNTIAALDNTGNKLGEISSILFNLNSAETCSELQQTAQEASPLLTRFSNDITMNGKLFEKVRRVWDSRESAGLDTEQKMLLEKTYRNFVLGGAGLDEKKKSRFRKISEELSRLSMVFEENVLADTNSFRLHLIDPEDIAGLPDGLREMAATEAERRKEKGWVFTLHAPSYIPFMKYSEKRELREKMFRAYASRSFHGDEHDNKDLSVKLARLRLQLAELLDFRNYAEMALADRMADSVEKVNSFLEELHKASSPAALRDYKDLKIYASENGHQGQLEKWDWAYYSEKLQKSKFNIDDEVLKPYFVLGNVQKAVFDLAGSLYGIALIPDDQISVYHPEVSTWRVMDSDGSFLAVLYLDFFPRQGKNGGAWMTSFREQRYDNRKDIRPLVSIVANFTRPTGTKPSLLTFNEVTTFLHEFGHALHGMLTKCTYQSVSGTSVARDFVELPSQFMENFAYEKEWLSSWALHYETGEKIPEELIMKIKESSTFNEGYACNRQLGFAFLDLAWHTITSPLVDDITAFETAAMSGTELLPPVDNVNMSVSFTHIFSGGYAAGYYGYKWAEVLDADAYQYFKDNGILNKETALSFRKNILERGGTDKPVNLYKKFRGKEPTIDAFLERSGLK